MAKAWRQLSCSPIYPCSCTCCMNKCIHQSCFGLHIRDLRSIRNAIELQRQASGQDSNWRAAELLERLHWFRLGEQPPAHAVSIIPSCQPADELISLAVCLAPARTCTGGHQ